jgi:transposase
MKESRTIGMDLGDQTHQLCILNEQGQRVEERSIANTRDALRKLFAAYPGAVVAMETGTHSPWISDAAREAGCQPLVGNTRKLRSIWQSRQKSDVRDAEMLARLARFDPQLLYPVTHRKASARADLALIKARDQLVRSRAALINTMRGLVKSHGERLTRCSSAAFAKRAELPEALRAALEPMRVVIATLTEQIKEYDRQIEAVAEQRYPETARLTQVPGVGTLTALAYVLTLERSERFSESRQVGAFLGLTPRRDQSGACDKQLRITKEGDGMLRRLLVGSAHYILGPFGPPGDLRRYGERLMQRGGKNAKRRAVVAVARKLAVLLHALWKSGEVYQAQRPPLLAAGSNEETNNINHKEHIQTKR